MDNRSYWNRRDRARKAAQLNEHLEEGRALAHHFAVGAVAAKASPQVMFAAAHAFVCGTCLNIATTDAQATQTAIAFYKAAIEMLEQEPLDSGLPNKPQ
jgi:hypothetical protein